MSQLAPRESTIAVLGLSYKPASHVVDESQAIQIVKTLVDRHFRVVAYDPLARSGAHQELGGRALVLDSIADCVRDADVVLVANADPEFQSLTPADLSAAGRHVTIVDFWRCLSPSFATAPGMTYIPYGRGPDPSATTTNRLAELWSATSKAYTDVVERG